MEVPDMDCAPVPPAAVAAAAQAVAEAAPEPPRGFVVSKTKRGRFRRLHCVEACPLIPGVHYKDFDVWGDVMPKEGDVHAVCTRCMPSGLSGPTPEVESSAASSSSASGGESGPDDGPS